MNMEDFHDILSKFEQANDIENANRLLMYQLGTILVKDKSDFVNLLKGSGINVDENIDDRQLVSLFMQNIDTNKKLMLGASLLVNIHNKKTNFDGENEVSDSGVKLCFSAVESYFCADGDGESDKSKSSEGGKLGLGQLIGAGGLGSVFGALGEGAKLGTKIADNRAKKKYGAQDAINNMMAKKADAKNALVQGVIAQKQASIEAGVKSKEAKAKTTKTILIVGGVVVGLAILGTVIFFVKNKKGG